MCGRYFIDIDDLDLEELLATLSLESEAPPERAPFKGGEIFPSATVPVITGAKTQLMTWGYPAFAGKRPLINARSETAAVKKTFSGALAARRCLVPASGYYEWKTLGDKRKEKYAFRLKTRAAMLMAGIYTPGGEFAILTREAAPALREIHPRMPALIPENLAQTWLTVNPAVLQAAVTDLVFTAVP